jgi:hypothetical protein
MPCAAASSTKCGRYQDGVSLNVRMKVGRSRVPTRTISRDAAIVAYRRLSASISRSEFLNRRTS